MIIKIEAKFKAMQLIDVPVASVREIEHIGVDSKGIEVILKDGTEHAYPIEIDRDPQNPVWQVVRNYKPLEDEIIFEKPKKRKTRTPRANTKPTSEHFGFVIVDEDDDVSEKKAEHDPFD